MNTNQSTELLNQVRQEVYTLRYDDHTTVSRLRDRTAMLIKKIFGADSSYLEQLTKISFSPSIGFSGMSDGFYISAYNDGKNSFLSLLDTMLEDIQLSANDFLETVTPDITSRKNLSNRVFIVHGHNEEI